MKCSKKFTGYSDFWTCIFFYFGMIQTWVVRCISELGIISGIIHAMDWICVAFQLEKLSIYEFVCVSEVFSLTGHAPSKSGPYLFWIIITVCLRTRANFWPDSCSVPKLSCWLMNLKRPSYRWLVWKNLMKICFQEKNFRKWIIIM